MLNINHSINHPIFNSTPQIKMENTLKTGKSIHVLSLTSTEKPK